MKLHNKDCIVQMQKMIDEGVQVDSVVTDPPYELNFMGKSWDSTGIAFQKNTWELALQLLKPGGHLLAFAGSRTYHRMAVAIEDAGFQIRDQIMWLYGSGFPKSLNVSKAIDKSAGATPTIVKEGDTVRRIRPGADQNKDGTWEKLKDRTYTHTITKGTTPEAKKWDGWGTALKPAHEPVVLARKPLEVTVAENVLKHGTGGINIDGCRIKTDELKHFNRESFAWEGKSLYNEQTYTPSVEGRYPANVMHDGLEQEWARFFYCSKVSKKERNRGLDKNNHPTVKPIELMKYLCRLVTPKGGTILDPFMGSGSTGMAAKDEGFEFIGIEKEKEYFEIAEQRINITSPLLEFIK